MRPSLPLSMSKDADANANGWLRRDASNRNRRWWLSILSCPVCCCCCCFCCCCARSFPSKHSNRASNPDSSSREHESPLPLPLPLPMMLPWLLLLLLLLPARKFRRCVTTALDSLRRWTEWAYRLLTIMLSTAKPNRITRKYLVRKDPPAPAILVACSWLLVFLVLFALFAFAFAFANPRRAMLLRLFIGSDPRITGPGCVERAVRYGKDSAYTPRYSRARGSGRLPPTNAPTFDRDDDGTERGTRT
mmetsp:Transcript_21767/g.60470  ORF Transcript_21767/g.60470 Transcript_21767/m.60470 type:complete len:247 (-) Transcript_21767:1268-2008(-)